MQEDTWDDLVQLSQDTWAEREKARIAFEEVDRRYKKLGNQIRYMKGQETKRLLEAARR